MEGNIWLAFVCSFLNRVLGISDYMFYSRKMTWSEALLPDQSMVGCHAEVEGKGAKQELSRDEDNALGLLVIERIWWGIRLYIVFWQDTIKLD